MKNKNAILWKQFKNHISKSYIKIDVTKFRWQVGLLNKVHYTIL